MPYTNFIPNTNIPYKLHAEWRDLVEANKNKTKFDNIYPYVFSDKMIYLIIHKPSRMWYCAYKKCEGKNDNYSSFIFFRTIGDLARNPEQFEIYATEFWYGDKALSITNELLQEKVNELKEKLKESHYGYEFTDDFNLFSHNYEVPRFNKKNLKLG